MEEIVKHINDTNASFRTIGAGDAKNTDLFLDNEHYAYFKDAGEQITVRFDKDNLIKAISFIASILPRKYDNSAVHKTIQPSAEFIYDQMAFLDAFFVIEGQKVEKRTQIWNARKDVPKRNGEIDNRFYFNGLLTDDVSYTNYQGEKSKAKFTIRNYLAGGYSDLHFKKAEDNIIDVWVTNSIVPQEKKPIVENDSLRDFVFDVIKHFESIDNLNAIIPYSSQTTNIKINKNGTFNLVGMFLEESIDEVKKRNEGQKRWFEDKFMLGTREVYLSTQWRTDAEPNRTDRLALSELIKMIQFCYGEFYGYCFSSKVYQLWFNNIALQRIYYGAPGTGKSNEIKRLTAEGGQFAKDFTFRTTFHPDSDYSTFVGAYKPVWNEEKEKIVYEFRPQAFLKAYVAAWTHPDNNVALVVEEINRGNCAQIFGDIFQLLDRDKDGLSKYPIESDVDMKDFLYKALNDCIEEKWAGEMSLNNKNDINKCYSEHYDNAFDKIKVGEILALPQNLSILATMNTSDQSLFPMDSAFKRRWDWKYQPIVKGVDSNTGQSLDWEIKIDGYKPIDWWAFIERINCVISDLTKSEDKQLGYFFCMPDKYGETTISASRFVEKVVFYLWNDVFKDYSFDPNCCNKKDKKDEKVQYSDFYTPDGKDINAEVLVYFINQLKTKDGKNDPLATVLDANNPNNEQPVIDVDEDNAVINGEPEQLHFNLDDQQPE